MRLSSADVDSRADERREWLADHALEPPETLPHPLSEGDNGQDERG